MHDEGEERVECMRKQRTGGGEAERGTGEVHEPFAKKQLRTWKNVGQAAFFWYVKGRPQRRGRAQEAQEVPTSDYGGMGKGEDENRRDVEELPAAVAKADDGRQSQIWKKFGISRTEQ